MVNIQVTGPSGAKKGYVMVAITRALRELGCEVTLQGEQTHLTEKVALPSDTVQEHLMNQAVTITELQTAL